MTEIELQVDNTAFSGWKNATVNRSLDSLCGSFSFSLVDTEGVTSGLLDPDTAVSLWINDNGKRYQILDGYIDQDQADLLSDVVTITGRDKTLDLVDCSAVVKNNTFNRVRFSKILDALVRPFDITTDTTDLEDDILVEKFSLQTGESPYQAIDRLCKFVAILPTTDTMGTLRLVQAGTTRSDTALVQGDAGIKNMQRTRSYTERFSQYTCKGQKTNKGNPWTNKDTQQIALASDLEISRYRPYIFKRERKATDDENQNRVNWEAQIRAGRSYTYVVTKTGWLQNDGTPWEINTLVPVRINKYTVDTELLITSVAFSAGDEGQLTTLTLRSPDMYAPNPKKRVYPVGTKYVLKYKSGDNPTEELEQAFDSLAALDKFKADQYWYDFIQLGLEVVKGGYVIK